MFLADASSYGDTNRDWKILGNLPANSLECESQAGDWDYAVVAYQEGIRYLVPR